MAVFGGLDEAEMAPLAEVYALGATRWARDGLMATAAYGGDLRADLGTVPWIDDLHQIDTLLAPADGWFGGQVQIRASAAGAPWASVVAAARLDTPERGRGSAELMLGAERRWDESWTATGLMVGGDAGVHVGSRVRLRGHVEGRAFLGAPSLAAANLGARWSPRPALALRLDVGLKGGWGTGAAWADQIGPGELAGWSTLSMELTPTRRWSAMADLNAWAPATSATSPTLVARAGVGVHASGQRLAPVSPERTLRYRAPDAAKVVVVGTFTDWQPRPMERQPDGTWTLTVVLPPGIHSYMYQVDGDTVTPPDAPLTSVDDFGLRQGVIIMPAPP